ncbi:hypothetical protein LCGC14_1861230 [marine sediment metagenome]|uniref:Uncharacterized protein n=1 Tax=marine sediment metagenome TaxID=412755 RepID=A0A0F9GVX2_9ZZZZ
MTGSFFLIHLIDKNKYWGINTLYGIPDNFFRKGRSGYLGEIIYIQNIEPEPEGIDIKNGFGSESSSIWLGVGIIPKVTFGENVELYKDLCRWVMDFLYLSRFLVNLNLKARVFFHVENYNEENNKSKLTFQRTIELNCDRGSIFQVNYNRYPLMLPLLTKLLQCRPTEKLRAIMYNYATSSTGSSGVINYFFSFATFEGVVHNWAEENGYSELWGTAIANSNEQDHLHEGLRLKYTQFIRELHSEGDKLNQLRSFVDSTFPSNRKILRSLRQRFNSYYDHRLTEDIQENEDVITLKGNFRRITTRRNEIGHSLETYLGSPGIIEDINTLMSAIKIIMDFELNQFLNNEPDWKFENRLNNLRGSMRQLTQDNLLHKFSYDIVAQGPENLHLIDRFGTRNLEKVEFHVGMKRQNDDDDDDLSIKFSQNLKLLSHQNLSTRAEPIAELGIVNAYANPYWWIITTQDSSHYIFKTFPSKKSTTTFNNGVKEVRSRILTKNILSVVKLDNVDIPDDLDVFAFEQ